MQVVFHAAIRHQEGAFDIDDVCNGISDKLVRRHPHVFADAKAETSAEVLAIQLGYLQTNRLVISDNVIMNASKMALAPLIRARTPEAEVIVRVDKALEAVKMTTYRDRLSHHLSVGEKKRIAIATVLSMQPKILILDEPSAGLDPRARRTLINLLRDLPITMLVSTHDMKLVDELFPRTIVMDNGRIVADGRTKEILEDEKLLTEHGLERP